MSKLAELLASRAVSAAGRCEKSTEGLLPATPATSATPSATDSGQRPESSKSSSCSSVAGADYTQARQRQQADLGEFATAVRLGCMHLCMNCQAFRPRPTSRPDGWCTRYQVETWARWAFWCDSYEARQ